jgi:AcrR family transcriptional regulator
LNLEMEELSTKKRILDAAEKLFADNGFSATSIRAVIKEAGVNTAAVHYHYGSREALIVAVLERRAEPVNIERLRLLDALEAKHSNEGVPLEGVIRAFLAPAIRLKYRPAESGSQMPKLIARALAEPDGHLQTAIREIFAPVFERFSRAFQGALPHLEPDELSMRMHLMIGAMAFSVAVRPVYACAGEAPNAEQLTDRLVQFIAAGMRAPVVATTRED